MANQNNYNCPEHAEAMATMGNLKGRLNLMIGLMLASLGGIITLLILSFSIYSGIQQQIALIDKGMTVNATEILQIKSNMLDVKLRVSKLEEKLENASP